MSVVISLDGVAQAPSGPQEDTDGGFAHGGWPMQFFDPDAMGAAIADLVNSTTSEPGVQVCSHRQVRTPDA